MLTDFRHSTTIGKISSPGARKNPLRMCERRPRVCFDTDILSRSNFLGQVAQGGQPLRVGCSAKHLGIGGGSGSWPNCKKVTSPGVEVSLV